MAKTRASAAGRRSPGKKRAGSRGSGSWYQGHPLVAALLKVLVAFLLFWLTRVVFFLLNTGYFSGAGTLDILRILLLGARFDLSAILIINAPFILMMAIPFSFRSNRFYTGIAGGYFYVVNSIAMMSNLIDTIYFRFTLKRITADIFTYVGVGGDFDKLVPQFLRDFWFVALLWIVFVVMLILAGNKFRVAREGGQKGGKGAGFYFVNSVALVVVAILIVIGIRGGFQLRPINLVTAGTYTSAKYVPLILNTPFSIAKTIGGERLVTLKWFEKEAELAKIYTPVHPGKKADFRPLNVVILIMESFSREHIGSLNRHLQEGRYQGFTPFLDSLIRQGLYFDAYANGKTSIQGIPAILSGIPSLMNESFIQSGYASGKYSSLAGLLKTKGYHSAFFHGGTNGTMGFDAYTRLVGFDQYFGRSEYNNEKDYDGKWGIRDEEFLQYTARTVNGFRQPFLAAFFSLSSHHPYYVPAQYVNVFRKGKLPIQQSVMYADHALSEFFRTVKKMPWYENTLFVITADHTSEGYYPFYQTELGQYAIPLLLFRPGGDLKGVSKVLAQQTDVMPTILDYLGYEQPFLAFGSSLIAPEPAGPAFSIHYISGIYGMVKDNWYIEWDGSKTTSLFNLGEDLLQRKNLKGMHPEKQAELELFLKAYLQQYNNRLIENRLFVDHLKPS